MPIAGSVYYLLGGTAPTAPNTTTLPTPRRLDHGSFVAVGAVVRDVRQGKTWKDIGWKLEFIDVPRAAGLLIAASLVTYLALIPIQYTLLGMSGHFLARKSLNSVFGFGISSLSIAFICLNPFFEELIVRAYTMSEIMNLGGSSRLAIIVSVAAQMQAVTLIPGSDECACTDVPFHRVLDLLCKNPKNRAGDTGSSGGRFIRSLRGAF